MGQQEYRSNFRKEIRRLNQAKSVIFSVVSALRRRPPSWILRGSCFILPLHFSCADLGL